MKRTLALLVLCGGAAFADPMTVNRSSYIAGATQSGCIQALFLDKVVVGEATSGGNIMLYNSSWTTPANAVISSVTLASAGAYDFNSANVKGICYLADTPTNGLTILYKK